MITFTALMYNHTATEFIDDTPSGYSLGWYTGHDIIVGSDGTDVTNLPISDFSYNQATNIGRAFEEHAKRYYLENQEWPILRLYKNRNCVDWIEWNHARPTEFVVYTSESENGVDTFVWSHVFQWDDNIPTTEIDGETVLDVSGLKLSMVWVSEGHEDNLTSDHIVWSGAVCSSEITGSYNVSIGYATVQIAVNNTQYLIQEDGAWLGEIGGRIFYKADSFPSFAYWKLAADWSGPVLLAPSTAKTSAVIIKPYSIAYRIGTSGVAPTLEVLSDDSWPLGWRFNANNHISKNQPYQTSLPVIETPDIGGTNAIKYFINEYLKPQYTYASTNLYIYLHAQEIQPTPPTPTPPPDTPDVDPENPPDPDTPPTPITPDNPDPYYNPVSDPDNPQYDPTKNPESPSYDPTTPSTPWRPPTEQNGGNPPPYNPTTPVTPSPTPPSYAINSSFLTIYTPTISQLNSLANYLWSSAWSIDGFKKIFTNPIDCILGLTVLPALIAPAGTKEVNVGNLSTGVTMSYVDTQYARLNCGTLQLNEYYASYLDYNPYTKVEIYLPYIGTKQLSADDVMGKSINPIYTIDILSGACVCDIVVDGTTLYTFAGSCATSIPISSNNWNSLVTATASLVTAGAAIIGTGGSPFSIGMGINAASSLAVSGTKQVVEKASGISSAAGLMAIQIPYLIVTRPRQALPLSQNSYTGYPSFITESLGGLTGYTEIESVHLEHIPATSEEIIEIERLLKEGVLF